MLRNVRGKKSVSFDEEASVINLKSDQTDAVSITTLDKNMASLLEEDWFHGVLPREDVVRLLKKYIYALDLPTYELSQLFITVLLLH